MNGILPLLLTATSRTQNIIELETAKFLSDVPKTAILITSDPFLFENLKFPFPTVRIDLTQPMRGVPDAYVIDLRSNWTEQQMFDIKRYPTTAILVITYLHMTDTPDFKALSFCNARFLALTEDHFVWFEYSDPCRGIGEIRGDRCRANGSFLDYPPRVLYDGKNMGGVEGLMVKTAAEMVGFDLDYVNHHELGWGTFDPPAGLFGDVKTGASQFGFGSLVPAAWRYENADVTFSCDPVHLTWAVPKAAGPVQSTWLQVLVSELSTTVWLSVFATYLLAVLASLTMWRSAKGFVPFHTLALFIGVPQVIRIPSRAATFLLLFGLIMTSCYSGKMSSILTAPTKTPDIKTIEELVNSGLELLAPHMAHYILKSASDNDPNDSIKVEMFTKFRIYPRDFTELLPRMANQRDVAYFRHGEILIYCAEMNAETAGKIHLVEESLQIVFPMYLSPKHSCVTPKFQQSMSRVCSSGLWVKWARDVTPQRRRQAGRGPRVLNLDHTVGFFYLLLGGWSLAAVAFALEQAVFRFSVKKSKITPLE